MAESKNQKLYNFLMEKVKKNKKKRTLKTYPRPNPKKRHQSLRRLRSKRR